MQPAPRAAGVAWGSVLANQVAAVMIVFGVFATVTMFGIVYARSRVQKDAPAADTPAAAGRRAGGLLAFWKRDALLSSIFCCVFF